jgi:hypothetical protein
MLEVIQRHQVVIGAHNEALPVAMCISNKSLDIFDTLRVKDICSPERSESEGAD